MTTPNDLAGVMTPDRLATLPQSAQDYIAELQREGANYKAKYDAVVERRAALEQEKADLDAAIQAAKTTVEEARAESERLLAAAPVTTPAAERPDPAVDPSQGQGNTSARKTMTGGDFLRERVEDYIQSRIWS